MDVEGVRISVGREATMRLLMTRVLTSSVHTGLAGQHCETCYRNGWPANRVTGNAPADVEVDGTV